MRRTILLLVLFPLLLFGEDNWYLRYKPISDFKDGVYADVGGIAHQSPWFPNFGSLPLSGKGYPWRWTKTDSYSPWLKIEKKQLSKRLPATIILSFHSKDEVKNIKVEIEVSENKTDILTSREITGDGNLISFLLPPDLKKGDRIVTVPEKIDEYYKLSREIFPDTSPDLKNFIMATGVCGYRRLFSSPDLLMKQYKTIRHYGINSTGWINEKWGEAGFRYTRLVGGTPYGKIWQPDFDRLVKEGVENLCKRYKENLQIQDKVYSVVLADEPGLLRLKEEDENIQKAFREYLRERGLNPSDFGLSKWEEVKPAFSRNKFAEIERLYTEREVKAAKKLYFHSKKFQSFSTLYAFKKPTEIISEYLPDKAKTYINFTPHPMIGGGMLSSNSPDWIEAGRIHATTMPWSEDWLGSSGWVAMSLEYTGFIADILRGAARYHNDPVGFYIIPSGNFPTLQKSFSVLGRGIKIIDFFDYGPLICSTENHFSDNHESLKGVGMFTRLISKIDDDFPDARLITNPVAILWSTSSEIWKDDNVSHTENMMLWLALDRNQIIPDFIEEEDIEGEDISNYKVIYATGKNITEKATEKLLGWVKNGGVLWLEAGFGMYNEYNRDNSRLREITGFLPENLIKKDADRFNWRSLASPPVIDSVSGNGLQEVPTIAYKQKIETTKGIVAAFSDNTPALVEKEYGKGTIFISCFMPGLSYGSTTNKWENKNFATSFNEKIFEWLYIPIAKSGYKKQVTVSKPGVQTTILKSPEKTYVVLVNYCKDTEKGEIDNLAVGIPGIKNYKRIWTVQDKKLNISKKNGVEIVLPLDTADVIVIE
jgi:hypothetical protein